MPQLARSLAERFPDEPFRQRLGFVAERLRHTRVRLLGERRGATTGRVRDALRGPRRAPRDPGGAGRRRPRPICLGGRPRLRLAGRDVRVPPREPRGPAACGGPPPGAGRGGGRGQCLRARRSSRPSDRSPGSSASSGSAALSRYIVSFTAGVADVIDVLELATVAGVGGRWRSMSSRCSSPPIALTAAGEILEGLLGDSALPGAPPRARRPPGGDARLLRLEQGVGLRRRELAASTGPRRISPPWPPATVLS